MNFKLLAFMAAVCCAIPACAAQKPRLSTEPVPAENLTIYRDFLASFTTGSPASLNVSELTVPFVPDDADRKGCLGKWNRTELASTMIHRFGADAFPRPNKLVDPQRHKIYDPGPAIRNGQTVDSAVSRGFADALFTFSEIVFDGSHTHAAFTYSFHCGTLCGNGGTVIYEKRGGTWKAAMARCSQWES